MPTWLHLYFQDSCSFVMEQLIFFHDHVMVILLMVMILVGYLLLYSCFVGHHSKIFVRAHMLESVWTFTPILLLLLVAFPSLRVLYLMEEGEPFDLSVKVVGHQWYWSYEYSDLLLLEYDSYMLGGTGVFRLLEVGNAVSFPVKMSVRAIVSSADVIHSWTLPSVGVKTDAIPGRLNQIMMIFNRIGVFVGQCSEICGLNHSFMPVVVYAVTYQGFLSMILVDGRAGVNLLN